MKASAFPARQVHLDFHTSEHIPGVGSKFSKRQFQEALKTGRVNWINIFAKCHHGWSYYPTEVGARHPTLAADLLGHEIDACHEIGVRCPIYYTVGWSARDADQHPEWCVRGATGEIAAVNVDWGAKAGDPRPPTSWVFLCPSGDYRSIMLAQTEEICGRYDVDGFWYDITCGPVCHCENCRREMKREGVDASDAAQAAAYNGRKWASFMEMARRLILSRHPRATVFFNGTTMMYRTFFINALRLIHGRPMLEVSMPSAGRVSLLHQALRKRYVAHLLYGPALQRGRCQVIEDLVPLYQVPVVARLPARVKRALLIPDRVELPVKRADGAVRVVVQEMKCHAAIVFEY